MNESEPEPEESKPELEPEKSEPESELEPKSELEPEYESEHEPKLKTQVKYILYRRRGTSEIRGGTSARVNYAKWDNSLSLSLIQAWIGDTDILSDSNNVDSVDFYITNFNNNSNPKISNLIGPRNDNNNIKRYSTTAGVYDADNAIIPGAGVQSSENNWTQNKWGGNSGTNVGGAILITLNDSAKFSYNDLQSIVLYNYSSVDYMTTWGENANPNRSWTLLQAYNGRMANCRFELYTSEDELIAYSDLYGGIGDSSTAPGNVYPISRFDGPNSSSISASLLTTDPGHGNVDDEGLTKIADFSYEYTRPSSFDWHMGS